MKLKDKSKSTVLAIAACALSLAANADTFWKGQGADSDFYNRDNWINWWNANYVFGGGQLGNLPADGSYVTFTNAAAIAQGLWIENAGKGGVEWSLADNAAAGAGLTITNNLTVGTGRAGQLTIKDGTYIVNKALYVADGLGTTDGGSGKSTLALTNCTMTVEDGVFIAQGANGANGEIVVQSGAVLNSTASSGDKFSVCKSGNGHYDTKGTLTIDGGTVNVASTLYTCQESGTGDIIINSGELNVAQNTYLARGWYNASTSTMTMNGGKFWTGSNFELAGEANRNAGNATLNMNGGTIDVGATLLLSKNGAQATLNMTGGSITATNHVEIATGGSSTANVTIDGGSITSMTGDHLYIAKASGSTANVTINNGSLRSTTKRINVGQDGTGTLTVNGGEVTWGDQLIVAVNSSSTGTLNVNGGTVAKSSNLLQVGLNGHGYFNMTGGDVVCSDFRLGSDSAGAVGVANMSGGTLVNGNLSVAGNGTGTFNLNGGVVEANSVVVGNASGTSGTLNLNGGALKARQNNGTFITASEKLTVNIGVGGAVFDSAGYNITIPATLNNADGLVDNGMIWKKGLGTLTISSNLDLERTFKFTINNGVGPIALTGTGNTLNTANGAKLTVALDPHQVAVGTTYALMSGLGELTTDDMVLPAEDDMYSYGWALTDGTLSVTVTGYASGAPVTARYENGAWVFYDGNGNVTTKPESENTAYIFTGAEPAGALESISATHRVTLASGTISVTGTVNAGMVTIPENATVTLYGSEAASFAATELINNGTLTLDGEIDFDTLFPSGNFVLAEGAKIHLTRTQSVCNPTYFTGTGELIVEDGVTLTVTDDIGDNVNNNWAFKNFGGTMTLVEGSTLTLNTGNNNTNLSVIGNSSSTLKMAGGTVSQFTRYSNGSNSAKLNNVIVEANTESVWNNKINRNGYTGVQLQILGTVTGGGVLHLYTNTSDPLSNRRFSFNDNLSGFSGTLHYHTGNFSFTNGIGGGTVIVEPGTHMHQSTAVSVSDATLVLKGNHTEARDGNSNLISAGLYSIGANGVLKVADNAAVQGVSFASGAQLELLDDGALSDTTQSYVALVSATPILGPLPTLVQPANVGRGKWKLVVREIPAETEEGSPTYQLVAEFCPKGLVIIIS